MLSSGKLAVDALPGDSKYDECVLGLEVSDFQNGGVCSFFNQKPYVSSRVATQTVVV